MSDAADAYGASLEARALALVARARTSADLLAREPLGALLCLRGYYPASWQRVARTLADAGHLIIVGPAVAAAHRAYALRTARLAALGLEAWEDIP